MLTTLQHTPQLPTNTTALELSFNQDLQKLSTWFSSNYLTVNHTKTQAMILGNFNYQPDLSIGNSIIEIESFLEILGVHIDNKNSLSRPTYLNNHFYYYINVLRKMDLVIFLISLSSVFHIIT